MATLSAYGRGRIVYVGFTLADRDARDLAPAFRCLLSASGVSSNSSVADRFARCGGGLGRDHSGFHVHTAVWVSKDDRAFATRLARYGARNPVALERLTYDRAAKSVTSRSDKGRVTTRYYDWYANRPRGMRGKAESEAVAAPLSVVPAPSPLSTNSCGPRSIDWST